MVSTPANSANLTAMVTDMSSDMAVAAGGNGSDYQDVNATLPEYVSAFDTTYIRWIFIVMYVLVFACCFFGNVFVILVVLRHRRMRTITNFFLANLAGADLCVGIFCVLPNLSTQLAPVWKLGKVMCKLYYFVQSMSYTASIMILTAISIERYFAIIHPMRSKQLTTLCLLRIVVVIVWTIAAGCAVPYLILYDTIRIQDDEYCIQMGHFDSKSYVTISFILWYLIPLCLMTVMYTKISIVLWKTSNLENLEKNSSFKGKKSRTKRKKKDLRGIRLKALGKRNPDQDFGLCKPVISVSGVATSTSSDETTKDEGRRVTYVPNTSMGHYDQRLSKGVASGYETTDKSGEEEDIEERSSEEAADFEDDWPSSHKNRKDDIHMKQVYTFRNPTYNGSCPACQNGTSVSGSRVPQEKCCCARSPLHTPPAGGSTRVGTGSCTRGVQNRKPPRRTETALLARRRVIRLLIAVIVSFAICVIPYHIRLLVFIWREPSLSFAESLIPPLTFLIFYFNSGLNPILYAFLSDNFRRSLREVLCCTADESTRRRSMRSTMSVKTLHSTI